MSDAMYNDPKEDDGMSDKYQTVSESTTVRNVVLPRYVSVSCGVELSPDGNLMRVSDVIVMLAWIVDIEIDALARAEECLRNLKPNDKAQGR